MRTITHNGVPCIEARVHMLPTGIGQGVIVEDTAFKTGLDLFNPKYNLIGKHLYITTNEEIARGDAKVFIYEGKTYLSSTSSHLDEFDLSKAEHIIATTDKSLPFKPPQIPQSFIEEYCKAGGIDKVLVEYTHPIIKWDKDDLPGVNGEVWSTKLQPKTDSNNYIIIHPVERYSYEKIKEIAEELRLLVSAEAMIPLDKWIKENL
jgi:hypothetical protein